MAQSSLGSSGQEEEQEKQKSQPDGNVNGTTMNRSKPIVPSTTGTKKPEPRATMATMTKVPSKTAAKNEPIKNGAKSAPSTKQAPAPVLRQSIRRPTTTPATTTNVSNVPKTAVSKTKTVAPVPSYARSTTVSSNKKGTEPIKSESRTKVGVKPVINSTVRKTVQSSNSTLIRPSLSTASSSNSSLIVTDLSPAEETPAEIIQPVSRRQSAAGGQSLLMELSLAQEQLEEQESFQTLPPKDEEPNERSKDLACKFGTFTKSSRSGTPSSGPLASLNPKASSRTGSKNPSINGGSKTSSINGSKSGSINGSLSSVKSPTHKPATGKIMTNKMPTSKSSTTKSSTVSAPTAPKRTTSLAARAAAEASELQIKLAIEINDLKKKLIESQLKLEEKNVSQIKLEQLIDSKTREIDEKDANLNLARIKIAELEEQLNARVEMEKELLASVELKNNQLSEKSKEIKSLQSEITDLGVSVRSDKDAKFKNLRDQIKNLQNDIISLNVVIDMRNESIKILTDKVTVLEDSVKDLPASRGVIETLRQKLEQAEITIDKKNELIRTLHDEKDYLRAQIESSSRVTKRLSMRNEELEFALSESFIRPNDDADSELASGDNSMEIGTGTSGGLNVSNHSASSASTVVTPTPVSHGHEDAKNKKREPEEKLITHHSMSASYILDPASSTIFGANTLIQESSSHPSSATIHHAHRPVPVTRSKTAGSTKIATPRERFRANQVKQQKNNKLKDTVGSSESPTSTPSPLHSRNNSGTPGTSSDANARTSSSDNNNLNSLTPSSSSASDANRPDAKVITDASNKPKNNNATVPPPPLERQRTFDSPVSHIHGHESSHVINHASSHVTPGGILSDDALSSLNSLSDDIAITNEVWEPSEDAETLDVSRASDVSTLGDPHLDPFITSTHSIDTRL